LKAQVDRLQKLVDTLAKNAASLTANVAQSIATSSTIPLNSRAPSPVPPKTTSSINAPQIELGKLNLKNLDICEALGQLTVSGVVRLDGGSPHNVPLMSEVLLAVPQDNQLLKPDLDRHGQR
jgi:hypothetical protein